MASAANLGCLFIQYNNLAPYSTLGEGPSAYVKPSRSPRVPLRRVVSNVLSSLIHNEAQSFCISEKKMYNCVDLKSLFSTYQFVKCLST
jgi:hypothetical protein